MSYEIAVITKIPPDTEDGNMASAFVYRLPQQLTLRVMMEGRVPVFALGEILVLDSEDGREIGGDGRKPSKWSVEVEHFGQDMEAAINRALELDRLPEITPQQP